MAKWQVIVGNIGTVIDTDNGAEAMVSYGHYKAHSKNGVGRAAGEPVTLMRDGEPHFEYEPPESDPEQDEYVISGRRNADRIDGYDRDDLGESPDF